MSWVRFILLATLNFLTFWFTMYCVAHKYIVSGYDSVILQFVTVYLIFHNYRILKTNHEGRER